MAVCLSLFLVGLPVWMLVAFLVKATSGGPVLYRQTRVGRYGRPFTMLKFRTMLRGAEEQTGPVWAQTDDPRYTVVGRWLRKLRLDEMPQLLNVIRGDMALVGPRPERPHFVERLAAEIPGYSNRHRVRPGITGLAQVLWRYDATTEDVRKKLDYDLFYIENRSPRLDAQILAKTIGKALRADGQ